MKRLIVMLLMIVSMLISDGKLDPGLRNRLIMTDGSGMPLDDGLYNVTFRIYDSSREGSVLSEKTANVESKNGVCQMCEELLTDCIQKGYKEVWISTQIEDQPEGRFRTRVFLEPVK